IAYKTFPWLVDDTSKILLLILRLSQKRYPAMFYHYLVMLALLAYGWTHPPFPGDKGKRPSLDNRAISPAINDSSIHHPEPHMISSQGIRPFDPPGEEKHHPGPFPTGVPPHNENHNHTDSGERSLPPRPTKSFGTKNNHRGDKNKGSHERH
ncbi:hypothetical protein GDO86_012258, partial [Hymenochirus boettgeri]